ncbi:uncharacterized protein PITG_16498 [Phytophthora infestans T30-4]|uniref:Transmembrane protein, putative n=2 Tax=Phytophthora infestans TaxID=4787 RepID=D0NTS7_PHYIT|nr:uncharacterized protein PITG_16498 [Phytophthora infestans T30-4]EEY65039.1 transmembrane protein, putative [Phytophthora infestans T30-4]|eukprot:XP_002897527.1 transmembrane protein, putative [Phytophthora infestans T30-4]
MSVQDADTNLSVVEISDGETSNSTTDSEDQTFVERTKLSVGNPTAAKPAAPNGAAKVLFFDGIRGLAAILVVIHHSKEYPTDKLHLGAVAVDIFFVLSSFLLTWLFIKKSMKLLAQHAGARTWTIALLDYFQKRFFRVYPLFAVTAIVLACVSTQNQQNYNINNPADYDLGKVLLFYTGYRFHVFWTLPLEIGYYFVLPVFVAIALGMRRFWWIGAIPLFVWILHEGFYAYRNHHMPLLPHLHTFTMGSMGAVIFVKADLWIKETKFNFFWWHTLALRVVEGLAIAVLVSVCFDGLFFDWIHADPVPAGPGFPFVSVELTIIFVIEMIRPSCVSSMFEWSVLRYWGKISFSVYLLHCFIIYHPSIMQEKKFFNRFFARFGLVLILATVSYHVIERPSQMLAQRISRFLAAQDGKDSGTCLVRFTCLERMNLRRQSVPLEEK